MILWNLLLEGAPFDMLRREVERDACNQSLLELNTPYQSPEDGPSLRCLSYAVLVPGG